MHMGAGSILVVDDDAEIRDTLTAVLQEEGYDVRSAENGEEALIEVRRWHPDLMLLDLMMPVLSGWEVLEALEESGEIGDVPIVVVSAMCAPGVRECLHKPVDLEELLEVVARHCRHGTVDGAAAH